MLIETAHIGLPGRIEENDASIVRTVLPATIKIAESAALDAPAVRELQISPGFWGTGFQHGILIAWWLSKHGGNR
jgi:hypothetical protein